MEEKKESLKIFREENRTKYFVHVLLFLFLASSALFALLVTTERSVEKNHDKKENKIAAFDQINLEGKSAVVFDVINNRELFSKNPDVPLPLASLTKVLTALVIEEKSAENEKIKISGEYLKPDGDSKLKVGDIWQAKDLMDFTLLTSSNDGALALAAEIEAKNSSFKNSSTSVEKLRSEFVKEMNNTAKKVGLTNSYFFNEHGLDREVDKGGAYGSARDITNLFEYTIKNHPQILEVTRYKNLKFESAEEKYEAENTNIAIDQIPNLIASKTGYTDLAGGNLVIAFDAGLNRPIIVSVLGSTEEGRFSDVLQLVEASIKFINTSK